MVRKSIAFVVGLILLLSPVLAQAIPLIKADIGGTFSGDLTVPLIVNGLLALAIAAFILITKRRWK